MRDPGEIDQPPELTDGHLRLRPLQPDDKAAVVVALNDETAGRFLWRPPFPYLDSDFDEWFTVAGEDWQKNHAAHWAITDAADDVWLGGVSLEIVVERESGEIGYNVGPWARGHGIAAAATRLVRDWALDGLRLERLQISTDIDNIASQRVALAAGFHREGVMRGYLTARGTRRDMVMFGIVPSDPREPIVPLPVPELSDGFVVVRPFVPDDAPAVAAACRDPLIQQLCYYVPSPYGLADAAEFIARARGSFVAGTELHCAVTDATDGGLLGAIDLVHFPERQAGETGYWVAPEARGRGVATAAVRLMQRYAFAQVGLERLELMTEPSNRDSRRVAEKTGFRLEGTLRGLLASRGDRDRELVDPAHGRIDQLLYALLRPEWEALAGRA